MVQRCLHPRDRRRRALHRDARQRADNDRDGNHDHAEHEHRQQQVNVVVAVSDLQGNADLFERDTQGAQRFLIEPFAV